VFTHLYTHFQPLLQPAVHLPFLPLDTRRSSYCLFFLQNIRYKIYTLKAEAKFNRPNIELLRSRVRLHRQSIPGKQLKPTFCTFSEGLSKLEIYYNPF